MSQDSRQNLFPFDAQKHIEFVINNQFQGGWSEEMRQEALPSPLVTSQMVLGLLPQLDLEYPDLLTHAIQNAIRIAVNYLDSDFQDPGWSDHSGGKPLIDATAAVATAILKAIPSFARSQQTKELLMKVRSAIYFLLAEKNDDGGWGIRRGSDSRMQFTYWAIMALLNYKKSTLFDSDGKKQELLDSLQSSSDWLKKNFESNGLQGFSIHTGLELNPVATALGIELFEQLGIQVDNEKIVQFLTTSRTAKGRWAVQDDTITFRSIPRRVYVLSDWPRIAESLLILRVPLSSYLLQDVLRYISALQLSGGGFKHRPDASTAIGWFTAQALKMFARLKTAIRDYEKYVAGQEAITRAPFAKVFAFSKGALMIGRFRPPHMGHYVGLKAILFGSEKDFSLPEDVLKELVEIDKVFIGITRYDIDRDNPWSVGEVGDIWRQIIDNDDDLRSRTNLIEIVSSPASRNQTNVADAIDELTSKRDSIIVISGNDRVLEQCEKSGLRCCRFARYEEALRGSRLRDIIARINWENPEASADLIQELQQKLHPAAFKFMLEQSLFKKAQKNIRAI
jgi:prenyltransferase beta subunit